MSSLSYVTTQTPLRISFAGGGTDFEGYYLNRGGLVVSTSIDKYVYVTAKRHDKSLNPEAYRLNYFESEHVNSLSEIKNNIIRGVLQFLSFDEPLYISTVADVPASSGLGSSSAFAVGLLNAIHLLRGERISLPQLAEEACFVEIEILKSPIGKQDQYACACGNLNKITFGSNGRINIENIGMDSHSIEYLFGNLIFFSTNINRSANSILEQQFANTSKMVNFEQLDTLKDGCNRAIEMFRSDFNPVEFGQLLDELWRTKKSLSQDISSSNIDDMYDRAMRAGALGGKISGAGGGGYLMFVVEKDKQDAVRAALSDLTEVSINYEPLGSRVVTAI